jgi:hypothetical protein
VTLYAGLLQLPLRPEAMVDPVEEALLPGLQARQFGLLPLIYGRRLWRDFKAAQGDVLSDGRPGAWAAAVEAIVGEQSNRGETQAAVGRHYRALLGAVSARASQIRRALGIEGFDARYSDFSTTEIVYKESDS